MSRCVFIGDELSAAGFRLAGLEIYQPARVEIAALLEELLSVVDLILISAEMAAWIPEPQMQNAVMHGRPPVLLVADVRGRVRPPDLAIALRRQLGLVE